MRLVCNSVEGYVFHVLLKMHVHVFQLLCLYMTTILEPKALE